MKKGLVVLVAGYFALGGVAAFAEDTNPANTADNTQAAAQTTMPSTTADDASKADASKADAAKPAKAKKAKSHKKCTKNAKGKRVCKRAKTAQQ